MKKIVCALLCPVILIAALASCRENNDNAPGSESMTSAESVSEESTENSEIVDTFESYINPVFSVTGGIFTERQTLTLSLPNGVTGYDIYYTTDGSIPTKRSEKYSEPITLLSREDSTVIRAACFGKESDPAGKVITHSYILKDSVASTLWTVSITAHTSDLDRLTANYNSDIEIPSHTEIITPEGQTVISQDTGLKIFGGSSRALSQKSFKINARNEDKLGSDIYTGKGSFSYPLFEDRIIKSGKDAGMVLQKYDSFILRNGGNDSIQATACDPLKPNLLRDSLSNRFAAQVSESFDYACSQFAAVYVNGEYYGILDMRENMNEDFVKNVYGVDDNDVVVLKSELDTTRECRRHRGTGGGACRYCGSWFYYETDEGQENYIDEWEELCEKAADATDKNYDEIYAEIEAEIDLDNLIEYYAINLYLCNTDWPHNNVKLWKYTGEPIEGIEITDGKWRFMYRDMDFTFGRYNSPYVTSELDTVYSVDTFYRTLGNYLDYEYPDSGETKLYADALGLQGLLDFLLKNDEFREKFYDYCIFISNTENTDALKNLLSRTVEEVKPEISRHLDRWQGTYASSYTIKTWGSCNSEIRRFIANRPSFFRDQLEKAMSFYE